MTKKGRQGLKGNMRGIWFAQRAMGDMDARVVRSLSCPPPTLCLLSISGITLAPIACKSFFVNNTSTANSGLPQCCWISAITQSVASATSASISGSSDS
jgi:hypothetical protein